MASKGFRERILEIDSDGTALTNSLVQTSLLPTAFKTAAVPLGYFDQSQRRIIFEFSGRISTVVTTPGTLDLSIKIGTVFAFIGGAMALNIVAKANVHFKFGGELVNRGFGATTTTTLFPKGCYFESEAVIGSPLPTAGGSGRFLLPFNAAPALGSGFDNGVAQLVDLFGTWSVASASNSIQVQAGHIDLYT